MADTERVTYIIELRDRVTRSLRNVNKGIARTDKSFNKLSSTLIRFAGFAAIARGLSKSIQKMAVFEETASNLSAITGAVGKDLDFLKRKAIELGSKTSKSSIQALEGMKLIASAKPELLSNAAALAGVTKEAITLAEASGLTLPDAAKALTSSLNQFGLSADQSSRVINVLAAGSKFAAAEIPDLSTSLEEFGGVADSLNISLEQSAASVETLSTKGLKGARAGIQLRNVFLKLGSSTDKNLNPKIVGLSKALENLAGIEDDTTALTKMFGRQNVLAAQTLIKQRDRVDELTNAMTGTTIAYEQASINTDNLTTDTKLLSSAWEGFILNLNKGEGAITNFARKATQGITRIITNMDDLNKSVGEIASTQSERRFASFTKTLTGGEDKEDLRAAIIDELNKARAMQDQWNKTIDELGGMEKASKTRRIGRNVARAVGLIDRENEFTREVAFEAYTGLQKYRDELMKILENEGDLKKFMEALSPEAITDAATPTPSPTAAAKKQIQTITGAAPKTFNINIEKLVENFEVVTENLTEGSEDIKRKIALTLAEALADVQPITD